MASSTLIVDYLGQGLAAARPVAPNVPSTGIALYAATDTGDVDAWYGGSWTTISSGGSGITELTGDVTAGPGSGSQAATIAANAVTTSKIIINAVTNARLAQMGAHTFKGNNTGATSDPLDLTAAQLAAELTSFFPGSNFINAVTKTTNYTITSLDAGASFDNIGASADITLTLPAASSGQIYRFAVFAPHYIKVLAVGSDVIDFGTTTTAAAGFVRSLTPYSYLIIEAHSTGRWVASTVEGKWNFDATTDVVVPFVKGAFTAAHAAVFDSGGNLVDGGVPAGGGSVTSVSLTAPAIFSVAGSPVTTAGTIGISATGTSGGVPYFNSATTMASSGALTVSEPVVGGGAGATPTSGTRKGNTTIFVTGTTASVTNGHMVLWDTDGNVYDGGSPTGGSVSSVAATVPGGFAVSGSPVTSAGTIGISASGTSGGILYYSSATTSASSGALTANEPVIGGGAGATPAVGSRRGNTTVFATGTTASVTSGHLASYDANGNLIDGGVKRNSAKVQAQWVSGAIVANGTVYLAYKSPYAGTVDGMDYFAGNGSFTTAIKINGTNVTSLSAVTVNSPTPASTAATGANTLAIGDTVTAVITGATSSPTDSLLNLNLTWS